MSIEPAAWSFTYTDYWGTAVTTFELHEPHERLTVHAQAVVETHGDELPWDTDRRVRAERSRLAGPAGPRGDRLDDRVPDRRRPHPAAGRAARARAGESPTSRRGWPASTSARLIARPADLPARVDRGHQHRPRGLGAGPRGLPGLQPRGPRRPALDRAAGPLRLGLPASRRRPAPTPRSSGESHSWVEWWCGSWVGYDPTLRRRLTERLRPGRPRPRLRRRGPAARHLLRRRPRRCSSPWR